MVKGTAISKVSKRLAKRDVLFAPGGKGAILKRPEADVNRRPTELRWAKVVAPAYISGSLMHLPLNVLHSCGITIAYITDRDSHVCGTNNQCMITGGSSHRPVIGEALGYHPPPKKNAWSTKKGMGQPIAIDICRPSPTCFASCISLLPLHTNASP